MTNAPEVKVGARSGIAKGIHGDTESIAGSMVETCTGGHGNGTLAVGELAVVLINAHKLTLDTYHTVVGGHEPLTVVRTVGLEGADGEHAVDELAVHVEAVACGIGQQSLPVGIGVTLVLGAEIALLDGIDEVDAHLRSRLPVAGVVAQVAIALVLDADDVDAVAQRIAARHKVFWTEVAYSERDGGGGNALNGDDDGLSLLEGDAGGILMVTVGVAVLQLVSQFGNRTEGTKLAQTELRGIGSSQYGAGSLAHFSHRNLIDVGLGDAAAQLGAETIGEVTGKDVCNVGVALVEAHLGTACKGTALVAGTALHDEAHLLDVVNAVGTEGNLGGIVATTEIHGDEFLELAAALDFVLYRDQLEIAIVAALARGVDGIVNV